MVCGSNRYSIEAEIDGEKKVEDVAARTPAEARKKFRLQYGAKTKIISVRKRN